MAELVNDSTFFFALTAFDRRGQISDVSKELCVEVIGNTVLECGSTASEEGEGPVNESSNGEVIGSIDIIADSGDNSLNDKSGADNADEGAGNMVDAGGDSVENNQSPGIDNISVSDDAPGDSGADSGNAGGNDDAPPTSGSNGGGDEVAGNVPSESVAEADCDATDNSFNDEAANGSTGGADVSVPSGTDSADDGVQGDQNSSGGGGCFVAVLF